ncbi:MAG: hypothetical protein MHM6MM_005841 [Cercozoa sp. M6MM]
MKRVSATEIARVNLERAEDLKQAAERAIDDEDSDDEQDEKGLPSCPVCLCGINSALAVIDGCSHLFHEQCIRQWAQRNRTCPTCRQGFRALQIVQDVPHFLATGQVVPQQQYAEVRRVKRRRTRAHPQAGQEVVERVELTASKQRQQQLRLASSHVHLLPALNNNNNNNNENNNNNNNNNNNENNHIGNNSNDDFDSALRDIERRALTTVASPQHTDHRTFLVLMQDLVELERMRARPAAQRRSDALHRVQTLLTDVLQNIRMRIHARYHQQQQQQRQLQQQQQRQRQLQQQQQRQRERQRQRQQQQQQEHRERLAALVNHLLADEDDDDDDDDDYVDYGDDDSDPNEHVPGYLYNHYHPMAYSSDDDEDEDESDDSIIDLT